MTKLPWYMKVSKESKEAREKYSVRSMFEAKVILDLKERFPDTRYGYETSQIGYVVKKKYKPDLTFVKPDGSKLYIELKGYWPSEDRTKHKAVRDYHPELDIRFVFEKAETKLRKGSKETYASYCIKNNIEYASQCIPDEWIKDCERVSN